ncbi:AcrR family transcriptional regulator [Rubricella aquisinus]|uniref:AcrR family transcriptional regulator n=2 Tax=Rubricella aquisinus TaxID=2028108 RepID=A0A840WKU0_9RHOB|nr:AcrR family transcriptional regulator [Rubricella aquisinus]
MSDIAKAVGISRQALYLHYPNRADLLIAATRYLDRVKDADARLAESRAATSGLARLHAYIDAWGGYIPEIHGILSALRAMRDTDAEAAAACDDRMDAMRQGCAAAVRALNADGMLRPDLTEDTATDLLWSILSAEMWEHLVKRCGWTQDAYRAEVTRLADGALIATPQSTP